MLKRIGCFLCVMFAALSVLPALAGRRSRRIRRRRRGRKPSPTRIRTRASRSPATVVKRKCGACHRADEKGRMTRISYRRTTPEGWEQTIKRMITLNNLTFEPAEARDVLRYLADHHGLAPEEAKPAAFEVERRQIEYTYAGDKDTEQLCTTCHSMGRVIWQRRTKDEWTLLLEMHRAIYPARDTVFRRSASQRRPDRRDSPAAPSSRQPASDGEGDRASLVGVSADVGRSGRRGLRPCGRRSWRVDGRSPATSRGEGPSSDRWSSPARAIRTAANSPAKRPSATRAAVKR